MAELRFLNVKQDDDNAIIYINAGVGVGVEEPDQKLHVRGASTTSEGITIENVGTGNPQIRFIEDTNDRGSISMIKEWENLGRGGMAFHDGIENILILRNGNIGIGNSDPQSKLEVDGDIVANGITLRSSNSTHSIESDDNSIAITKSDDTSYLLVDSYKRNAFLGTSSSVENISGNFNVFVGFESGKSHTSGWFNTFVGDRSGSSNTDGENNVFVGTLAGANNIDADNNTFLGFRAGCANTTGGDNVCIGKDSGYKNTTGDANTFLGNGSGYGNTTGRSNVCIGNGSGYGNTTGEDNVWIGNNSGYKNTTGHHNTFIGRVSGYKNTSGHHNTFLGYGAGYSNTTGQRNTFVGDWAGYSNSDSIWNSFFGDQAGFNVTEGMANTFLGRSAGSSITTGGWNVCIGHEAGANEPQGSTGILSIACGPETDKTWIYGKAFTNFGWPGVGLATKTINSVVTTGGSITPDTDAVYNLGKSSYRWDDIYATNSTIQTSDVRKKDEIADCDLGLDFINQLRPVHYKWKDYRVEAENKVRNVEKQKTEKKTIVKAVEDIQAIDGKHVKVMKETEEEIEEPIFEKVNIYDEENNIIGEHEIPVMETVEVEDIVQKEVDKKYKRKHYGLISQEVKEVMDMQGKESIEFAGYVYDEESDLYGLRYQEFIAPMIKAIQELNKQNIDLQARIDMLEI